ncbi:MAG: GntR family transcriptional regulator [Lactococcus plantarum]|nr:GntR family transcriptional regulator [Lactococcus plantarum]MDN6084115.1 GntR family transcriptional regulator [Lactococcus plantarum]
MNKLALYEQLCYGIKHDVAAGILKSGDKLPSVRKFALEKNINPNTAVKVYKTLENEGVIHSIPSKGNFISDDAQKLQELHLTELKESCLTLIRDMRDNHMSKSEILEIVERGFDDSKS